MPATSQAQQRFMAICLHDPKHAKGKCPDMSASQMRDFASTPRKGLPARASKAGKRRAPGRRSKGV
jgi:hypothetical protein